MMVAGSKSTPAFKEFQVLIESLSASISLFFRIFFARTGLQFESSPGQAFSRECLKKLLRGMIIALSAAMGLVPVASSAEETIPPDWHGLQCHCISGTAGGIVCWLYRNGQLVNQNLFCTPKNPQKGDFTPLKVWKRKL